LGTLDGRKNIRKRKELEKIAKVDQGRIPLKQIADWPLPIRSPAPTVPPFSHESAEDSLLSDLVSSIINRIMKLLLLLAARQRERSQDITLLCMISVLPCVKQALCSTMPWSISIAWAVFWGVCWMFPENIFDWTELQVEGFEDIGYQGFGEYLVSGDINTQLTARTRPQTGYELS
jgi:hypothetical protein